MSEGRTRIKFAWHSTEWDAEKQTLKELEQAGQRVAPDEFLPAMRGALFCPGCGTALSRRPLDKPRFSNGRWASFFHLSEPEPAKCDLRSKQKEGNLFESEAEAAEAVERGDLVIVNHFMAHRPEAPAQIGEYDQSSVEDVDGPPAAGPVLRHEGDQYLLPSRIQTMRALCRRFDENLERYYLFPGRTDAVRLRDELVGVDTVFEVSDVPRLYYGQITRSWKTDGSGDTIRMTRLAHNASIADFTFKLKDSLQQDKGMSDRSTGRYVLFWGRIVVNGMGLGVEKLSWGEFALLPEQYAGLLSTIAAEDFAS